MTVRARYTRKHLKIIFLAVVAASLICIVLYPRYAYLQPGSCAASNRLFGFMNISGYNTNTSYSQSIQTIPAHLEPTLGKWLRAQQPDIRQEFKQLEDEGVYPDDPRLLAHVRQVILPPSPHKTVKLNHKARETPQSRAAMEVLKGKCNGFFIECGALNGERASNTLFMEQKLGWSGLLIEVDPYFFLQLIGHNRQSYSVNACLSPRRKPCTLPFTESHGGLGAITSHGEPVPCYPLDTLLLSLNVTKVDFLSLDVEGQELAVLKTIPFDKLDITVLAVETAHVKGGEEVCDNFMKTVGYVSYKHITYVDEKLGLYVDDTIYVKETYMKKHGLRPYRRFSLWFS